MCQTHFLKLIVIYEKARSGRTLIMKWNTCNSHACGEHGTRAITDPNRGIVGALHALIGKCFKCGSTRVENIDMFRNEKGACDYSQSAYLPCYIVTYPTLLSLASSFFFLLPFFTPFFFESVRVCVRWSACLSVSRSCLSLILSYLSTHLLHFIFLSTSCITMK